MAQGVASHIHIGALEFLIFLTYLVIAGFILRITEICFAHTKFGRALAFLY